MKLHLLILLVGVYLCSAEELWDANINQHLKVLTTQRYPSPEYKQNILDARKYIKDRLQYYGLQVKTQEFNTSVNTAIVDVFPNDQEVTGQNIIGLAPAKSDRPEAVIVVTASYDTNGIDDPMTDNGAGVAVLLETARLFLHNVRWSMAYAQNFTTIFVATDINTRQHLSSGGKPGGWYFVHEWLWNYLNKSSVNFGGAYVIDSVMNVNLAEKSQLVRDDFREMFPDESKDIEEDGSKGDFLAMVNLHNDKCLKLNHQFATGYNMENIKRPFHLTDLTLPKTLEVNRILASLSREDAFHYWAFEEKNVSKPLPALLLTDTGNLRDYPTEDGCEGICELTRERNEFLTQTTNALVRTLLSRQAHPLPSAGNLVSTFPAVVISMAAVLLIKNHL